MERNIKLLLIVMNEITLKQALGVIYLSDRFLSFLVSDAL